MAFKPCLAALERKSLPTPARRGIAAVLPKEPTIDAEVAEITSKIVALHASGIKPTMSADELITMMQRHTPSAGQPRPTC